MIKLIAATLEGEVLGILHAANTTLDREYLDRMNVVTCIDSSDPHTPSALWSFIEDALREYTRRESAARKTQDKGFAPLLNWRYFYPAHGGRLVATARPNRIWYQYEPCGGGRITISRDVATALFNGERRENGIPIPAYQEHI